MGDHMTNGSTNGNGTGHGVPTSPLSTTPFPASRKVYAGGAHPGVRVPMREISLTPTKAMNGGAVTPNEPITVYDTSGPYTDPSITIDVRTGLSPLRRQWVLDRQDIEELPAVTSMYGRMRAADVMTAIQAQGVLPQRIQLGLRLDPGRGVPLVRVYVR